MYTTANTSALRLALLSSLFLTPSSRNGPLQDAIKSGAAATYKEDDCIWRRGNDKDSCPDPDIHVYIHTSNRPRRELRPETSSDWLRQDYEATKENVILIHGYAGSFLFFLVSKR